MSIPSRNFMPEFLNCSEKMSLKAQKNCSCGMCSRTNYVALGGCNVCVDFICVIKYQQFLCAACDLSKLKSLTGKQGKLPHACDQLRHSHYYFKKLTIKNPDEPVTYDKYVLIVCLWVFLCSYIQFLCAITKHEKEWEKV